MANALELRTWQDAPLAYQSLNSRATILEVNMAWERLTGYTAAEMVGHNYLELVPEEHFQDFYRNLELLMTQGELVGQDCFLQRKDGSVLNVQIFARLKEGGDLTDCMLVDVTGFRRTERELIESEGRFRSLFALAPTPIAIHDERSVLMANQACARFLGFESPDELIGLPLAELVPEDDRSDVAERVGRLIAEGGVAPARESRFVRKDGTLAFGEAFAAPVVLDGQRVVYVVALDLAERLRAQEALEESESRFRDLFEFSGDPIVVHDGRVAILANRAALESFGLAPDTETAGIALEDFIEPDSMELVARRIAVLMSGQQEETPAELHLRRADGTDWHAEAKSAPLNIDGRRVLQTTFRDLSERKRTEEELRRYRSQLEALLDERTESLARVRQELDAVIAVVSRTVEMRDPYTAGHQRRVAALAVAIARQLGMADFDVEQLEVAALLHDVGKVGIPAELLSKPGKLTALEDELVRSHVDAGHEIALSANFESNIAETIRQHHERIDGSGYPQGLVGDELLPTAKVLMVADVVEAMSSHRPYRPTLGAQAALDEVVRGKGTLYEAEVVEACVAVIASGFDLTLQTY